MRTIIDCDRMALKLAAEYEKNVGGFGTLPRKSVYGSAPDLIPYGDTADQLVSPSDYKEVIAHCHEQKLFPMYHQNASWMPKGKRWNQNGLPYCWAWGITTALQDCRAREGKPTVDLAPVSLGHCVGWASRGNYLESAIAGARDRGVAPAEYIPDQHSRSYRSYKSGWEEAALNYRVGEVYDTNPRDMIRHAISVLRTGTTLYIAYNWWSHALACCGVIWDESKPNNLRWVIRNSHNEDDFIELTGSRGIPDEAYGVRSTKE